MIHLCHCLLHSSLANVSDKVCLTIDCKASCVLTACISLLHQLLQFGTCGSVTQLLPYIAVHLQEPAAQQLVAQLNAQLSALPSTAPDVAAETAIADSGGDMAGTLLIRLTSFNDNIADRPASDADGSRLSRRMNRAWQDMVKIAAQLLSSSSRTGDSDDMPRLALVHMTASCSTRLALCRRRTTSKLLRRSGKVTGFSCHAAITAIWRTLNICFVHILFGAHH